MNIHYLKRRSSRWCVSKNFLEDLEYDRIKYSTIFQEIGHCWFWSAKEKRKCVFTRKKEYIGFMLFKIFSYYHCIPIRYYTLKNEYTNFADGILYLKYNSVEQMTNHIPKWQKKSLQILLNHIPNPKMWNNFQITETGDIINAL